MLCLTLFKQGFHKKTKNIIDYNMYKWVIKFGGTIVSVSLFISMFLVSGRFKGKEFFSNLPIENEYRLKFVDSVDYELGLSATIKIIYPVDILKLEEINGLIKIYSLESSIVYAPIDCNVVSNNPNEIVLKYNKLKCSISNIISGVKSGTNLSCGDVIGSLKSDYLLLKVFWGDRQLTLKEIEVMI